MTIMTHDVIDSPVYEVIPACRAGGRQRPDTAAAQLRRLCADAQAATAAAKLESAVELLERKTRDAALREQQATRRSMPVGSAPGVSGMDDFLAQYRAGYEASMDRRCAEAKAAYDARNPHKRKEAQT